jgi:hypothetical protein
MEAMKRGLEVQSWKSGPDSSKRSDCQIALELRFDILSAVEMSVVVLWVLTYKNAWRHNPEHYSLSEFHNR